MWIYFVKRGARRKTSFTLPQSHEGNKVKHKNLSFSFINQKKQKVISKKTKPFWSNGRHMIAHPTNSCPPSYNSTLTSFQAIILFCTLVFSLHITSKRESNILYDMLTLKSILELELMKSEETIKANSSIKKWEGK